MHEHPERTTQLDGLVDQAARGDGSAREDLFRRTYEPLQLLAHRILERDFPGLGQFLESDDVLQNALIRLLHALSEVRPASLGEFTALATTEIRRELLDRARQCAGPAWQYTHQAVPAARRSRREPVRQMVDPAEPPADLEDWSALHREIESLPAKEREAVMLMLYQGWTEA